MEIKTEEACQHILNEIRLSSESLECHIWDMEAPSKNHMGANSTNQADRFTPVECDSELKFTVDKDAHCRSSVGFEFINGNGEADPSTVETEPIDMFECFEPLESPGSDSVERRRGWLEQRRYRAWIGARNLHVQ